MRPRDPYWTLTYDPASHRNLAIRCIFAVRSLFSRVVNLLPGAHEQHDVGRQTGPEDEKKLTIEVHWTVRMLQKRITNGAGCLPGYELQARGSGLPDHYWHKRCDSKQQPDLKCDNEVILHELKPSRSEFNMYRQWFQCDGNDDNEESDDAVHEHDERWKKALRELSLKEDVPVLEDRKRKETMREWFRDLCPDINELVREDISGEPGPDADGSADVLDE